MKLKEKDICKAFFKRYKLISLYNQFKNKAFIFHIANEQNCNKFYTIELKRMGLTAGVADYCVLTLGGRVGFIEFKRNAKCKLTVSQENFSLTCITLGVPYIICWDVDTAIEFINNL